MMHAKNHIGFLFLFFLAFFGLKGQHFPAKFEDEFDRELIKAQEVGAIQVESQISWHPDSTRKMFVGFEHLNFSRRPYARFDFDSEGFLVQEIDFWDSTHTTYYPDSGNFWSEKQVIRWEYEYYEDGKISQKRKITPYLGKQDTAVTQFVRKKDEFGRVIEILELREGMKKREVREYELMGKVIFREVWMEIAGQNDWVFRDSISYHQGATGEFKNIVRTFATGKQNLITDKQNSFNQNREIRRLTIHPDGTRGADTFERRVFEDGRLVEVELPVNEGVNFCGISAKKAQMFLEYDQNGLLTKRIYQFGPWINTFYYSYQLQP